MNRNVDLLNEHRLYLFHNLLNSLTASTGFVQTADLGTVGVFPFGCNGDAGGVASDAEDSTSQSAVT